MVRRAAVRRTPARRCRRSRRRAIARISTACARPTSRSVKVRRSEPRPEHLADAGHELDLEARAPARQAAVGPPMSSDGVRIGRSTTVTVSPAAGERVRRTV